MRLKYLLRHVDERLVAPDTELLSVSKTHGVVPRAEISDTPGRAEDISNYKTCQIDDLVINRMSAYQGALGIAKQFGAISPDYMVLRMTKGIRPGFSGYLFKSRFMISEMSSRVKGIGSVDSGSVRTPRLNWSDLGQVEVDLPPAHQQEVIADFLDRETAKIDALIARQEQLISTLDERRRAVISRAVTGGINSDIDLRSAETAWFKMIPSHWEAGPLKRFANVTLGKMVTSDTPDGDAVVMPYLRAASVQPKGRIILDDAKQMSFSLRERSRFALKKNDVVVVEGGSIGRSALVEEDLENWGYQNSINRVRAMRNVTGSYLNWCLQALESSGVYSTMTNVATIAHLTAEKLETVPIAVPPLSEQDEICAYLEKVTQDIDLLIEKCSAASRVLRERRQALISAAVTGKLEVGV